MKRSLIFFGTSLKKEKGVNQYQPEYKHGMNVLPKDLEAMNTKIF